MGNQRLAARFMVNACRPLRCLSGVWNSMLCAGAAVAYLLGLSGPKVGVTGSNPVGAPPVSGEFRVTQPGVADTSRGSETATDTH